ncbi:hypothetical protein GTW69_37940 [Streptomyces sp. SID7760]|nr:hypothetical protein [Streptomyces sp. SID7760]
MLADPPRACERRGELVPDLPGELDVRPAAEHRHGRARDPEIVRLPAQRLAVNRAWGTGPEVVVQEVPVELDKPVLGRQDQHAPGPAALGEDVGRPAHRSVVAPHVQLTGPRPNHRLALADAVGIHRLAAPARHDHDALALLGRRPAAARRGDPDLSGVQLPHRLGHGHRTALGARPRDEPGRPQPPRGPQVHSRGEVTLGVRGGGVQPTALYRSELVGGELLAVLVLDDVLGRGLLDRRLVGRELLAVEGGEQASAAAALGGAQLGELALERLGGRVRGAVRGGEELLGLGLVVHRVQGHRALGLDDVPRDAGGLVPHRCGRVDVPGKGGDPERVRDGRERLDAEPAGVRAAPAGVRVFEGVLTGRAAGPPAVGAGGLGGEGLDAGEVARDGGQVAGDALGGAGHVEVQLVGRRQGSVRTGRVVVQGPVRVAGLYAVDRREAAGGGGAGLALPGGALEFEGGLGAATVDGDPGPGGVLGRHSACSWCWLQRSPTTLAESQ